MKASVQFHAPAALPPFPRKSAPGTRWIGGWVGPRAGLDMMSKRKIPSPHRDSNLDNPIFQPVVSRYTDWAVPALVWTLVDKW
jgi:hypothetical protein